MNLLIDIGNSRLKWALEIDGEVQQSFALWHETNFLEGLMNEWRLFAAPEVVAISAVSTELIKSHIIELVKKLWQNVTIVIAKSSGEAFGVKNSYPQPQKLGVDRWLCLLASHQHYQHAAWIVDCGTAITVDFINEHGTHEGGLITAGLRLMRNSLLNNTAALGFSEQATVVGLANQTDDAIFSGTVYAAAGLIEKAVASKTKAELILTGGDAELIARYLSIPAIIEPNLVLNGLALLIRQRL
ncbi:MAG: type III pantothenate kinase [Methylococcaceae bacterium]|nr:type III pantothenate kinase [Methylococcaceae bacterium]